jgi:stage III sporulation protein AB
MMILLLYGGIVLGCGLVGWNAGEFYSRRRKTLEQMLLALELLEGEIVFSLTPIGRALSKVGGEMEGPVGLFFRYCAQELDKGGVRLADCWKKNLCWLQKDGPLLPQDVEPFGALGGQLGRDDETGQRSHLLAARQRLDHQLQGAREAEKKYKGMYRNLGLIAGLFLAVLLV